MQVEAGREVMTSQLEVIGPVVEFDTLSVVIDPEVKLNGTVVEEMEELVLEEH